MLCEPTLERYTEIYTRVIGTCGSGNCHGADDRLYRVGDGNAPETIQTSYDSAMEYIDEESCADPEASVLLTIARSPDTDIHLVEVLRSEPGYTGLMAWLAEGLTVVRPDVGVDADMDVPADTPEGQPFPCDGLPTLDALPYSYPFDSCPDDATLPCATFAEHINPILMEQCALSDCHGSRGNGMYLLTGDDVCVAQWNYFSTYWYIDHLEPLVSPVLTRPVVDDPQDSHDGLGALGNSDGSCERRTIRKWLLPGSFANWEPCR